MRRSMNLLLLLCLAGCGKPAGQAGLRQTSPAFDPIVFWAGHHRSWGVVETRAGTPAEWVATDCVGSKLPDGSLHMAQTLTEQDGTVTHRDWHLWRTGPASYAATANDMVGVAHGTAAGRSFHWRWVLARAPGNSLKNITLDQWMYLMEGGTLMNHTTISAWGIDVAQVSEEFQPAP